MDRRIVYAGQIPYENDVLLTNKFAMLGVGKLADAILGTGTWLYGFPVSVTTNSNPFVISVGAGQIYFDSTADPSAYSSLAADATAVKKQGLLDSATSFTLNRPTGSGNSKYYLIEVSYQDSDSDNAALVYYNSANPSQPFVGPGNSGTAQPTNRKGIAVLNLLEGSEATSPTVPTASADATPLYTIRLSQTTSTISEVSSQTVDGIFKAGSGNFISMGGGGNLTQATADTRYGRLGSANSFTAVNTINVANAKPLVLQGGTSDGTGIEITGNGGTNPKKTLRVKDGKFEVVSNDGSTVALELTDAGQVTVTGKVISSASLTGESTSSTALATIAYCHATFQTTGSFLTQASADTRFLRLNGQGTTSAQSISAAPNVVTSQLTGGTPNNLANGILVTAEWANAKFATSAASGMQQSTADGRYLRTGLAANITETVAGLITFSNGLRCSVAPSGSVPSEVVTFGYLDSNYFDSSDDATHNTLTISSTTAPTSSQATRRSWTDSTYATLAGGNTFTGTQTFTSNIVVPATPTSATHAASKSYVDAQVAASSATGKADLAGGTSGSPQVFTGYHSFVGGVSIAADSGLSGAQVTTNNALVRYDTLAEYLKLQPSNTATPQVVTSGIRCTAGGTNANDVMVYSQVLGTGSVLARKDADNAFTTKQSFRHADGIDVGPVVATADVQITFGSNNRDNAIKYDHSNNQLVFLDNQGNPILALKDDQTVVPYGPITSLSSLTVANANVSGAPSADTSVLRRIDVKPSAQTVSTWNSLSTRNNYTVLPNGVKMAWGTVVLGASDAAGNAGYKKQTVSVNTFCSMGSDGFSKIHNISITPDVSGGTNVHYTVSNRGNNSFTLYANAYANTPYYFTVIGV